MELGLAGKAVAITAAGSGIGLAIADTFAAEGAQVVGADLDPTALEQIAGTSALRLDLLAPSGCEALIDATIEQCGRIDVLVNVLGEANPVGGFLHVDDAQWVRSLELNLMGMVRACRAAIPHMQAADGGVIVNIASDVGRQPDPFFPDYCAAKAAVLSVSKSLSIEFAPAIRCNAVAPGPTRTPAFLSGMRPLAERLGLGVEDAIDHFVHELRRLPRGRLGEPAEVASVVAFLASERASNVTGAVYGVDGGVLGAA